MKEKPLYFYLNHEFYCWETGLPVAASNTRTLARCFPENQDFYTWVDEIGERVWQVATPESAPSFHDLFASLAPTV